ncbi:hypothetical protein L1I79_23140 [Strepomyces sp. STD 3.1]|uniref:hypothetical protein n=1 Tax=Streptomyces sp. NPDC058985 TaxID=3346684 RepID=UPI001F2B76F8|nr:hypothetical protein [Streptomyces sp. STD 3.1]
MPHVDPAQLVELALGNDVTHDDADALRHLAACGRCREELHLMTRVVMAARGVEEPDLPSAPPAHVWQRIAQGLSESDEPAAPAPEHRAGPPPVDTAARERTRGRSPAPGAAALALGLLAGVAVVRWRRRGR